MTVLGGSVAISRSIVAYPTLTGQALRYAVAATILASLVRRGSPVSRVAAPFRRMDLRSAQIKQMEWLRLVALSATGLVGFNVCLLAALRHAEAAVVGTIVGCSPLVLAIVGPLSNRARPAARLVLASAVVVAGAALVEGTGRADRTGLLAAAGTLAGEVLFSLLAAPLLPRLGAVRVSAWTCALAVPMLGVSALVVGERPRVPTVAEAVGFAYVALVLTVGAFLLWYAGLHRLGVARAGMFVGVLPVSTLLAAAVLDGQLPRLAQVIGVLVVAAGLTLPMLGRYAGAGSPRSPEASAARTSSAYRNAASRSAPSASTP
jgi:drug/metabolite transporter (DMT)-like permease